MTRNLLRCMSPEVAHRVSSVRSGIWSLSGYSGLWRTSPARQIYGFRARDGSPLKASYLFGIGHRSFADLSWE